MTQTTAETITDTQIETLLQESAQAGDDAQVAICRRALDGDDDARAECARVIADAEAQIDGDPSDPDQQRTDADLSDVPA